MLSTDRGNNNGRRGVIRCGRLLQFGYWLSSKGSCVQDLVLTLGAGGRERTYGGKSYWNKVLLVSACSPKEYGDTLGTWKLWDDRVRGRDKCWETRSSIARGYSIFELSTMGYLPHETLWTQMACMLLIADWADRPYEVPLLFKEWQ